MTRAVFLDRDGVINRAVVKERRPFPPASLDQFELLPGVIDAVARLKAAGFCIIVVTNQPDVATGVQQRQVVEAMHDWIRRELQVDDIKVCYHMDQDNCRCRKPRPGMLQEAARERSLDLPSSFMIGDRWRDIAAGQAAGCKTLLIKRDYDERTPDAPNAVVDSLLEATDLILLGRV